MSVQVLYSMLHAIFVVWLKLIFAWFVLFIHHLMGHFSVSLTQCNVFAEKNPFHSDVLYVRAY